MAPATVPAIRFKDVPEQTGLLLLAVAVQGVQAAGAVYGVVFVHEGVAENVAVTLHAAPFEVILGMV